MARTPRLIYDGMLCHILQRGNNKRAIFKNAYDYLKFKDLIKRYMDNFSFELYNYCLMPNHIHLLLKIIKKEDLSKIFKGIFQSFQLHHRREYEYTGTLYQNRFKSIIIDSDSYLLECARYIERNPLRAGLVTSLEQYKWSSYHFYASGIKDTLITENPLYSNLANTAAERQKLYVKFLSEERPYDKVVDSALQKMT